MRTFAKALTFGRCAIMLSAIATGAALSGCSGSVQPDPAPKPLTDIKPSVTLDKVWARGIGSLGRAQFPIAPALDLGTLYASDAQGRLQAIQADNGNVRWTRELKAPVSSGIGNSAGQLFMGTRKGEVLAVDASTGDVVWRAHVASEVLSTPQANSTSVIVQSVDGTLTSLDRLTGQTQWLYAASQPTLTLRGTHTPRTIDQVSFAGFANGRLALFDNNDGHMLWDMRLSVPKGGSEIDQLTDVSGQPLLTEDGRLFATSYNGRVVSLNVRGGEVLWSQDISSYRSPVYADGMLYVIDARSHVHALDASTGAVKWSQDQLEGRALTTPAVVNGQLVLGDLDGYIHLLDINDGRIDGRQKAGGDGISITPLTDGQMVFVTTNDGRIYAYTVGARKS